MHVNIEDGFRCHLLVWVCILELQAPEKAADHHFGDCLSKGFSYADSSPAEKRGEGKWIPLLT